MTELSLPSTFASVPNYGTDRIIRQNDDVSNLVAFIQVPRVPPIEAACGSIVPKVQDVARIEFVWQVS